jgi:hypothetical protein
MSDIFGSTKQLYRAALLTSVSAIMLSINVSQAQPNIQSRAPGSVPAERTVRDADSEEFRKIFQALLDDRALPDRSYIYVLNAIYIALID